MCIDFFTRFLRPRTKWTDVDPADVAHDDTPRRPTTDAPKQAATPSPFLEQQSDTADDPTRPF